MTRSIEPSVRDSDWVHAVWDGEGVGARVARGALLPAAMLFEAIGAVRSSMYASGVLATRPTAVPALSVGNLTVGGTGKTPLAAFLARRLRDQDAKPAIVLRGMIVSLRCGARVPRGAGETLAPQSVNLARRRNLCGGCRAAPVIPH